MRKIFPCNILSRISQLFCRTSPRFHPKQAPLGCKSYAQNKEVYFSDFMKKEKQVLIPVGTCNSRFTILSKIKFYSTESNKPKKLNLMKFELLSLPSFIKTIKNWIFSTFIIRPYFDNEFSLPEFVSGTKLALEIVSKHLSVGDFSRLEGLVTEDCINEVKKSISQLSLGQRQELSVRKDDVYFCFPYEVGVIFDESQGNVESQKRSVEITMVFHVLKGLKEMKEKDEQPPLNMGVLPEFRDKIFICNYRFIRDYTKGVSDQWTINIINHFKPMEHTGL